MLDQIRANDVIVVWKLDRLARSTRDLLETMEIIRQAGGKFQSLSETLGRYHHPRGQADYDYFRWDRRVRARSNPRADRRRTRSSQKPRCSVRAPSKAAKMEAVRNGLFISNQRIKAIPGPHRPTNRSPKSIAAYRSIATSDVNTFASFGNHDSVGL